MREESVVRVREAVERLGYVRDINAANLAPHRRYRFVFLLPEGDSQFLGSLENAVDEAAGGVTEWCCELEVLRATFRDPPALAAAGDASASGQDTVGALKAGLDRIRQVGDAGPGDRTMIDALEPALEALSDGLPAAAAAARKEADHTATITRAKAGRASYISEDSLRRHNDPGAEAGARLFEFLAHHSTEDA